MPARKPQVDLADYLRKKNSPLADHVPSIIEAANRHRIDPRLLVAISGGETSFGTAGRGPSAHNAWGIGPGRSYGSWAEGIDAAAKLLRQSYIGQGLHSLTAIQQKWAPLGAGNDPTNLNSNWTRNIGGIYSHLGGDPTDVTRGWRKASSPQRVQPPTAPPKVPSMDSFGPSGSSLIVQQAMANLRDISSGEDPTKTLDKLVQASIQQTLVNAAAMREVEVVPDGEQQTSPDGGSYKNTPTKERASEPKVQKAVQIALRQLGKPYVWGTQGPKSFDCSGLIEWAFEQAGIPTPGRLTTWTMRNLGKSVKGSPLLPGDWVITNKGKHVVMYIGGGEVVAAPRSGTNVQVQKLEDHRSGIVDVRRYP